MIVFDTETHPIRRGCLAPRIVCASWCEDAGPAQLALWRDTPAYAWLTSSALLVGANTAYDMTCIMAMSPEFIPLVRDAYAARRVRDVQIDAKLLDIAAGRYNPKGPGWSLEALAARIGIVLEKDDDAWRRRYAALDGIPIEFWPEGAREYALADARATLAVYLAQEEARTAWLAA